MNDAGSFKAFHGLAVGLSNQLYALELAGECVPGGIMTMTYHSNRFLAALKVVKRLSDRGKSILSL